jgi:molybdate transport system regulatory protein
MRPPVVRFRVDFTAEFSVGIGKIELLESIARTGSLSEAAREMSMSYRRAWLLMDSLNSGFDTPVASTSVGGIGGGGAVLTDFGRQLVMAYRGLEAQLSGLVGTHLRAIAAHAVHDRKRGTSPSPRRRRIVRAAR